MESDELVNKYKRDGHFDSRRRLLLAEFQDGSSSLKDRLDELLTRLIDMRVEENPELLLESRGKLVALILASLTKQHMYADAGSSAKHDSKGSQRDRRRASVDGSTQADKEVVGEISALLSDYVKTTVSDSETFNKELEQSLNEIAKRADGSTRDSTGDI